MKLIDKTLMILATLAYAVVASSCNRQNQLPVGVFDSGTGGFTVLEKILALDEYDNRTGANSPDGIPDFEAEDFQYLADQANMPYGRYDAEGKAAFLTDLAVKDAFFLTGEGYFKDASSLVADCDKAGVKIVVIGCNTATAYGLDAIRDTLAAIGSDIKVIGVVEAGAESAVSYLSTRFKSAAVGVLATPGTISSGVYERMLNAAAADQDIDVQVISQSGHGFAEAVDEEKEFVNRSLTGFSLDYRGPILGSTDADIDPSLIDAYHFDFSENKAFGEYDGGKLVRIQLNSSDNYARFNMTNLIEKARLAGLDEPLRCIVLGCTHYPFLLDVLKEHLEYLRNFELPDGSRPYSDVISEDCVFIDPAQNTALQCYKSLMDNGLLRKGSRKGGLAAFISVPSSHLPASCLSDDGGLKYEYKYGREINDGTVSTVVVPMTPGVVNQENLQRIERLLPLCWEKLGL